MNRFRRSFRLGLLAANIPGPDTRAGSGMLTRRDALMPDSLMLPGEATSMAFLAKAVILLYPKNVWLYDV